MISERPSSQFSKSASSSRSSSRQPSTLGSWDADDDESTMSIDEDHAPARSLAVAVPYATGPYCPRRPTLREILAGTASAPYTLPSFMAFLSNNLCLENLEFTMDAGRYAKHYAKMLSKTAEGADPSTKDRDYVKLLWVRLIDAYIAPNGSREVNLPSFVRDPILNAPIDSMPPVPETLDLAVRKTYELMEESVLVPFLNSCTQDDMSSTSWNERYAMSATHEEQHGSMFSRMKKSRESSPPHSAVDGNASGLHRINPSKSRFTGRHHGGAALTTHMSNTSDANLNTTWSGSGMTDDSGSTGSPTNESPMTPPMSPPSGELHSSLSSSPRAGRDNGMWKKLGRLSGMGKKKSSGFSEN